eukprot:gene17304-19725_t
MNKVQLLILVCSIFCWVAVCDVTCDLILRNVPGKGIGVFAGRDWFPQELVEVSVGIPISYESVYWNQLINYCEGYNETHTLLTLGYSMLYNHISGAEQSMVQKHMSYEPGVARFAHTSEHSIDLFFEPNSVIFASEEIFSHYGDDYFTDRGIEELAGEVPLNSIALDRETTAEDIFLAQNHPHNLPGCPLQLTEYKNGVLRAMVDIKAGEYIEVVRALLLPTWATTHTGLLKEFLWWKPAITNPPMQYMDGNGIGIQSQTDRTIQTNLPSTAELYKQFGSPYNVASYSPHNTSYALLLTGHGALYSPSRTNCDIDSQCMGNESKDINVIYDWWRGREPASSTVECELTMLVSFKASRDILKGEDLPLSRSATHYMGM